MLYIILYIVYLYISVVYIIYYVLYRCHVFLCYQPSTDSDGQIVSFPQPPHFPPFFFPYCNPVNPILWFQTCRLALATVVRCGQGLSRTAWSSSSANPTDT